MPKSDSQMTGFLIRLLEMPFSDPNFANRVPVIFQYFPLANAKLLWRHCNASTSPSNDEVPRTVILIGFHSPDGRVVNLCIIRNVPWLAHRQTLKTLARQEIRVEIWTYGKEIAAQLPSGLRSMRRNGKYSIIFHDMTDIVLRPFLNLRQSCR